MAEKRKALMKSGNRHGKRRGHVPIKTEVQPQKDRIPKNELPKRIVKGNLNPEIKRKLTTQKIVSKK